MYRQIFVSPTGNLTLTIPQSWYGQQIEVIAFPIDEMLNTSITDVLMSERIAENRKKREENSRKYAVSFSSLGFKFNREDANNYDE
ncbi:MAG: hypothetical protein LBE56_11805 [Tannerella sp.]|jgi:hypothetical protein|nr:hypothetical protein [Tannerella sp.]